MDRVKAAKGKVILANVVLEASPSDFVLEPRRVAKYEDLKNMGIGASKRMLKLAGVSKYRKVRRTVRLGFKPTHMDGIIKSTDGRTLYMTKDTGCGGFLSAKLKLSKKEKKALKREAVRLRRAQ
jgi:hypothetical protein